MWYQAVMEYFDKSQVLGVPRILDILKFEQIL